MEIIFIFLLLSSLGSMKRKDQAEDPADVVISRTKLALRLGYFLYAFFSIDNRFFLFFFFNHRVS